MLLLRNHYFPGLIVNSIKYQHASTRVKTRQQRNVTNCRHFCDASFSTKQHYQRIHSPDGARCDSSDRKITSHQRFDWISDHAPRIPACGKNIQVLNEPGDFFNCLKYLSDEATQRIVLASLYLGTGPMEKDLVNSLCTAVARSQNLRVSILLDFMRGSRETHGESSRTMLRELVEVYHERVQVAVYHTPDLRGIVRELLPQRYNETFGVNHLKVYLFDDSLIMSGANLSESYFTNRQDRYILVKNCPALADYFERLVTAVMSLSFHLQPSGEVEMIEQHCGHPFKDADSSRLYRKEMRRRVERVIYPSEYGSGGGGLESATSRSSGHRAFSSAKRYSSSASSTLGLSSSPTASSKLSSFSSQNSILSAAEATVMPTNAQSSSLGNLTNDIKSVTELNGRVLQQGHNVNSDSTRKLKNEIPLSNFFDLDQILTKIDVKASHSVSSILSSSYCSQHKSSSTSSAPVRSSMPYISFTAESAPSLSRSPTCPSMQSPSPMPPQSPSSPPPPSLSPSVQSLASVPSNSTSSPMPPKSASPTHFPTPACARPLDDADTYIYPLVQMRPFSIRQDELTMQRLLTTAEQNSEIFLASGYFNLTTQYMKSIIQECRATFDVLTAAPQIFLASGYFNLTTQYMKSIIQECRAAFDVLTAAPQANGFYGARGPSGAIPDAYTYIARQFYEAVVRANQSARIRLYEYSRPGWTVHTKGLWYYANEETTPCLTAIGSPNFGYRSVYRDLECQMLIVTSDESLRKQLHEERLRLYEGSELVTDQTFTRPDRKIPTWVTIVTPYIKNFF